MVRNSNCLLCGVSLRCKEFGNTKKYCPHCNCARIKYYNELYRSKKLKQIREVARKYRETHRAEIRAVSSEKYAKLKAMKKHYNEKLLEDLLKNPRKYLKRVKVNK